MWSYKNHVMDSTIALKRLQEDQKTGRIPLMLAYRPYLISRCTNKYQRWMASRTNVYFSKFQRLGCPRSRGWPNQFLTRVLLPGLQRDAFSLLLSKEGERASPPGSSHKGINLITKCLLIFEFVNAASVFPQQWKDHEPCNKQERLNSHLATCCYVGGHACRQ